MAVLVDHDGRSARSGRPFFLITTAVLLDHDDRSARLRRSFRSITTAVLVYHDGRSTRSRRLFDCCSTVAAYTTIPLDRNMYGSVMTAGCTRNNRTVRRDRREGRPFSSIMTAILLDHDSRSIAARPWQPVRPFRSTETCTAVVRRPAAHGAGIRRAGTEARAGDRKPLHGTGGTGQAHISEHAPSMRQGCSGGMARPEPQSHCMAWAKRLGTGLAHCSEHAPSVCQGCSRGLVRQEHGKPLHGMGGTSRNRPSTPLGTHYVRAPGLFGGMAVLVNYDGRSARSRRTFLSITTAVLLDHDGRSGRSRRPFWSILFGGMAVLVNHDGRSARSRRTFLSITTAVLLDHDGRSARS